jgi:hypothetical protein
MARVYLALRTESAGVSERSGMYLERGAPRRSSSGVTRSRSGRRQVRRAVDWHPTRASSPLGGAARPSRGHPSIQDHVSFLRSLAEVVRSSACDPVQDHLSRCAEQDDRVEPIVELPLVPHASLNEEGATIIGVQQPGHPLLDPQPLRTAVLVRGLDPLAPARIIGIYDAIPTSAKFGERLSFDAIEFCSRVSGRGGGGQGLLSTFTPF